MILNITYSPAGTSMTFTAENDGDRAVLATLAGTTWAASAIYAPRDSYGPWDSKRDVQSVELAPVPVKTEQREPS